MCWRVCILNICENIMKIKDKTNVSIILQISPQQLLDFLHIHSRIFMKFKTKAHKIVIDHHIKFHKYPIIPCGDICKIILTLV